jgi:hypothetical protein
VLGHATRGANVKNEKQYEALKKKGMSKARAAKIATPDASKHGGKSRGRAATQAEGGTAAQLGGRAQGRQGRGQEREEVVRSTTFGYAVGVSTRPGARRQCPDAEDVGFEFASISDHYHPWVSAGSQPVRMGVLGGIASHDRPDAGRHRRDVPVVRIHPAVIKQAVATTSLLFEAVFESALAKPSTSMWSGCGRPGGAAEMLEEAVRSSVSC